MKIAHISLSYRPILGGQDTYIESLKDVLAKEGHRSTVYQAVSFRNKIDRSGIHAIRTPPWIGRFIPNFNWYYFNFFLRLFRFRLKKEDLLIVHYAHHYPAVKSHPRVVILSHGIEWHRPADQWDDGIRGRRARESFKKARVVANDTEYLRFCGVPVEPSSRYFEEVSPGKWFIPNCVDTEKFARVTPDKKLQALNAILVPRSIYFLRGIHLAIEAFGLLVKESGYEKYNLVIVGNIVDKKYYQALCDLIETYEIKDRVIFMGHVKWLEMPAVYAGGVCTMIPTIDCEGTSLSALESMACGTPVLSTDVGGLKDLPCLHVKADPRSLKEGLVKVLSERERFAHEQKQKVNEIFNMQNWREAWLRVIQAMS